MKSSDNYRFSEDFRRTKINYFAQIESIMEVHFGDSLLQVLFLTLFMLESVGLHQVTLELLVFFLLLLLLLTLYLFILG